MEITLLVKSFAGLISILAILIFFLLYSPKAKKQKSKKVTKVEEKVVPKTALPYLVSIIKNKNSSAEELKNALELIIKHHGTIHPKLGLRPHPDFDLYGEVLLRICRHPNTNKNLIIDFDRELSKRNEEYKRDISDFITKGLNSRGM